MACSRRLDHQLYFPAPLSYQARERVEKLYWADVEKTQKILKRLKEEGALSEINSRYYSVYTPLEEAALLGETRKVKCLVEEGGAKDYLIGPGEKKSGWSALAAAASFGQEDTVLYLLSKGARGDLWFQRRGKSVSLVLDVVENCCIQTEGKEDLDFFERQCRSVQHILKAIKKSLFTKSFLPLDIESCMQQALTHDRSDLLETLLGFDYGISAARQSALRGQGFVQAVAIGDLKIVQWFIETYPIPIDFSKNDCESPLAIATRKGMEDIVHYLKERSKNPVIIENAEGESRFYSSLELSKKASCCLAVYLEDLEDFEGFDSIELCCAFLRRELIDEPMNEKGNTLLHLAARWPSDSEVYEIIIPRLFQKGASRLAKNNKNQTPFDLAAAKINRLCPIEKNMSQEVLKLYKRISILLPMEKPDRLSTSSPL